MTEREQLGTRGGAFPADVGLMVRKAGGEVDVVPLQSARLTRIAAITRAQVDTTARPMTLTVGTEPIELPEVLAEAMVQLLDGNRSDTWLFPGRNPGRPITPGPLSRRLRQEGLLAGSARVTALMDLTRQLHPRIVSDLLGITASSAAAWARLSGGEWSDYPALRSTST